MADPDGFDKPIIMGTNLDEGRYWYYYVPELAKLPTSFYHPWLTSLVGDRADEVWHTYQQSRPELNDSEVGVAIAGDVGFRMPAIRMADSLSARGVPVWMYLATVKAIDLDGTMGAPHAVDLPFVFNTLGAASTFVANSPANQQLANQVQDLWTSFAATGTPTTPGVTWPTYNATTRATLVIDPKLRVENDPLAANRTVWQTLPFDGLNPSLDRLTPLQFAGTSFYTPDVIIAVIGWPTIVGGLIAFIALIVAIIWVVHLLRSRRRRAGNLSVGGAV